MRINYEQKFHSVGQGLFYSSSSHLNNNVTANVIFDCGSENLKLVNKQIDNYPEKDIDILIISHLHYDHVSGLNYLLKNRKVNTVILPYLYQKDRLLLQFQNFNKPEWYNSFLSNPYSYLNENENINRIVIINGDNEENEYSENFPEEFPPFNDNLINEKNIIIRLQNTSEDTKKDVGKSEQIEFDGKLSLMKDRGYVMISNMYFSFFNYKINNNKKITDFKNKIANIGITDTKSVLTLLNDDKKRELIRKSYEILRKDLNITSLATYQGFILPLGQRKHSFAIRSTNVFPDNFLSDLFCCNCDGFIEGHFHGRFMKDYKYKFYYDCFCDFNKHSHCPKMIGTILLGDIKLDYKSKKQKELFIHFNNLLPSVKLIQLSHHGAENGWADDLIEKIPESCVYLASHGINNKYHHPHKKVVMKLAENSRKYLSVTEGNEYYNRLEFDN
jgi:metal-dependent hydrolase (beta-lactamase superfamily II)